MFAVDPPGWSHALEADDQWYGGFFFVIHHLARPPMRRQAFTMVAREHDYGIVFLACPAQRLQD